MAILVCVSALSFSEMVKSTNFISMLLMLDCIYGFGIISFEAGVCSIRMVHAVLTACMLWIAAMCSWCLPYQAVLDSLVVNLVLLQWLDHEVK